MRRFAQKAGKAVRFLVFVLLFPVLILPAYAIDTEEIIDRQEDAVDIAQLERAARKSGSEVEYGETLDQSLLELWDEVRDAFSGAWKAALRSGVSILAIILFCAVGEMVLETAGNRLKPLIPAAGALAVGTAALADVDAMLGLGSSSISAMASFSDVLLPIVAAVTAATGAITGASVRQMAAVLFSDLLMNLIRKLLIPLLYGYVAAAICYAALGNEGVKKVSGLLKWTVTTLLSAVVLAFVGYLSVSKVVAGSADAMTVKAAKFAISGTIPVVGGILSDAAETILASAGVLRGTVGVFGTVTILGICLIPLLRMAIHYLVYKVIGAVSAAVGLGRLSLLVEQIGGAFGLMMGMTGACCLLMLIAVVSSLTAMSI